MWKHKTNMGRVVYDRPPTLFRWNDAARITRAIPCRTLLDDVFQVFSCIATARAALRCLVDAPDVVWGEFFLSADSAESFDSLRDSIANLVARVDAQPENFPGFSGGSFGGAGASRSF